MRISLLFVLAFLSVIFFDGCENKIGKISQLVEQHQYTQARETIRQLDPKEASTPEVRKLLLKAEVGVLSKLVREERYREAKEHIRTLESDIVSKQELQSIVVTLDKAIKNIINGKWAGYDDKTRKRRIVLWLKALNVSAFDGRVYIDDVLHYPSIKGGSFDGRDLSAIVFFARSSPSFGRISNSRERTLAGIIENEVMKISLDPDAYIVDNDPIVTWTLRKEP